MKFARLTNDVLPPNSERNPTPFEAILGAEVYEPKEPAELLSKLLDIIQRADRVGSARTVGAVLLEVGRWEVFPDEPGKASEVSGPST
jgi:hypothetical protein